MTRACTISAYDPMQTSELRTSARRSSFQEEKVATLDVLKRRTRISRLARSAQRDRVVAAYSVYSSICHPGTNCESIFSSRRAAVFDFE